MVDLGYGAEPLTTLEMASRLRRLNPALPVLGVEIDPERVAAARPFAGERTDFRLGGFNLPLVRTGSGLPESVRMIRAFNVLRQYEESAVAAAWQRMGESLLDGGVLMEGTSDPFGRLWVANLLRKCGDNLKPEALVFSVRLHQGLAPEDFQAVLPKNLIHRVTPGEPIHDFFADWSHAAQVSAPHRVWGLRQWFVATVQALAANGWVIDCRRAWLRDGFLILKALQRTTQQPVSE